MSRHGARRRGRKDEKRWSCWHARSDTVRREQRAIEKAERRAGQDEASEQAEEGES